MASPARSFLCLLKSMGMLAWTRAGAISLAVVLPFAASHAVVMTARRVGMPERLLLDLVHGFIVLAYLTALVRVAHGTATGAARFGFAWPRGVRWPELGAVANMAAVVIAVGLPAALLLHPIVQAAEAWQGRTDLGVYLPVTMVPEFVMTTLIGLVIAAHRDMMADDFSE